MRTEGSHQVGILIQRHTARAMARKLEVDHKTLTKIAAGSVPRKALRKKIRDVYGVPEGLFELPALPEKARGKLRRAKAPIGLQTRKVVDETAQLLPPREVGDAAPLDSRAELAALVADLRADLARLQADKTATPRERAQVASAVTQAMRLLTKVDGSTTITMSQILRSEHWVKLRDEVCTALAPFPEALAVLNETLKRLAA